jgi:hypothetical protein
MGATDRADAAAADDRPGDPPTGEGFRPMVSLLLALYLLYRRRTTDGSDLDDADDPDATPAR